MRTKKFFLVLIILFSVFTISCKKENNNSTDDDFKVERIEIVTDFTELKEYLTIQLIAKIYLENGEQDLNKNVKWSSSNPKNATIDSDGAVFGIFEGTTKITASCEGIESEIEIIISPNPVATLEIVNIPDELVVSYIFNLKANIILESGDTLNMPELINWSVDDNEAAIVTNNQLLGIKESMVTVIAKVKELINETTIFISAVEEIEIDPFLASPADGYIEEVPVVLIRFLPTIDGKSIDVSQATDYWELGEISLGQLKSNINKYDKGAKYMLEEGSKFRGYNDESIAPYLGYKVLKYYTVYEQIPSSNYEIGNRYQPDYIAVFNRFNLNEYVNENNIKEVWLWYGEPADVTYPSYDPNIHGEIEKRVGFVESNMSSPTTGDISNSYRYQDDIPILNHTFVVYCYNFRRTQAEMVHNHGHQLESIFKYTSQKQDGDYSLFVQDFCGWGDNNYTSPPMGRAGDCHHPPNTTVDYDYQNTTLVESDIEDWKPNNSGEKTMVNADTWGNIDYDWPIASNIPQKVESHWYIYWMQNMPGYQNAISYSTNKNMSNWWIFTADWDNSINLNIGLHE